MELICRNCTQTIPNEHYDWERMAAICPYCRTWSGFSQPTQEALRHTAEVFRTNQLYVDFIHKLRITRGPHRTKIEMPSHRYQTADEKQANVLGSWMSAVSILISVVLAFAMQISGFSELLLVLLFAIPGLALGVFVILNRGTYVILVDTTRARSFVQLPSGLEGRTQTTSISGFKQFYVKRRSNHRTNSKFVLYGINSEGEHVEIFNGSEMLMLLAESEIERLQGIQDAKVGG
ncbi:MAG: hypothetical protein AAGD96_29775, partial [Chloroflexota bacterium]